MPMGSEQREHLVSDCQGTAPEGISSLQLCMLASRHGTSRLAGLSKSTCSLLQACSPIAPQLQALDT